MSFFGFDPAANPGTRETDSSFYDESGDAEYTDTYDGLAEDLDQNYDELNDETFGAFAEPVGKDFDFSSQTAKAASALEEEEKILLSRRRQQQHESSPAEPGYQYNMSTISGTSRNIEPQIFDIPELKPMASLWEADLTSSTAPAGMSPAHQILMQMKGEQHEPKKILSLEEVEAQLLAASRAQAQSQPRQQQQFIPPLHTQPQYSPSARAESSHQRYGQASPGVQTVGPQFGMPPSFPNGPMRSPSDNHLRQFQEPVYPDHELPRQQVPPAMQGERTMRVPSMPERKDYYQILQQHQQLQHQQLQHQQQQLLQQQNHTQPMESLAQERQQQYAPIMYAQENPAVEKLPEQPALTEEEVTKELKAARLSRYNGLMTSSDKNHVTRIQLQQLVTEDPFTEDFYYQVYTALHGPKDGQSGVSNTAIAEKYLNEYGRRSRYGLRRQQESMQRMQQRAIAAAKAHPKHEQYVVEGALGKIAFATVKGPRRILDLAKRAAEERV
ncbi:topoisomerase II-associated protein PAT1 [Lipomyces kononenkoae]